MLSQRDEWMERRVLFYLLFYLDEMEVVGFFGLTTASLVHTVYIYMVALSDKEFFVHVF